MGGLLGSLMDGTTLVIMVGKNPGDLVKEIPHEKVIGFVLDNAESEKITIRNNTAATVTTPLVTPPEGKIFRNRPNHKEPTVRV